MMKAGDIKQADRLFEKYGVLLRSYNALLEERAVVYLRVIHGGKPIDFNVGVEGLAKDYLENRLIAIEDELLSIGAVVENPIKASSEVIAALREAAHLAKEQEQEISQ